MKTQTEIETELDDIEAKINSSFYLSDPMEQRWQGWIEALRWVIGRKKRTFIPRTDTKGESKRNAILRVLMNVGPQTAAQLASELQINISEVYFQIKRIQSEVPDSIEVAGYNYGLVNKRHHYQRIFKVNPEKFEKSKQMLEDYASIDEGNLEPEEIEGESISISDGEVKGNGGKHNGQAIAEHAMGSSLPIQLTSENKSERLERREYAVSPSPTLEGTPKHINRGVRDEQEEKSKT